MRPHRRAGFGIAALCHFRRIHSAPALEFEYDRTSNLPQCGGPSFGELRFDLLVRDGGAGIV